jgi:hypothetical protein
VVCLVCIFSYQLEALLNCMPVVAKDASNKKRKSSTTSVPYTSATHSFPQDSCSDVADDDRIPSQYEWPPQWSLSIGLGHKCVKYETKDQDCMGGLCLRCDQSAAAHKLIMVNGQNDSSSSSSSSVVKAGDSGSSIFMLVRNIRCVVGEYDELTTSSSKMCVESLTHFYKEVIKMTNSNVYCQQDESLSLKMKVLEESIRDILSYDVTSKAVNGLNLELLRLRLQVIIAADVAYHRIYYLWLTHSTSERNHHKKQHTSSSSSSSSTTTTTTNVSGFTVVGVVRCIPHPPQYFGVNGMAWDMSGCGMKAQAAFMSWLDEHDDFKKGGGGGGVEQNRITKCLLLDEWELSAITSPTTTTSKVVNPPNPLQWLWQIKWREMLKYFFMTGWFQSQSIKSLQAPG